MRKFTTLVLLLFISTILNNHIDGKTNVCIVTKTNNSTMNCSSKNTITHVTLTCYHPVKEQCDDDPHITADGSKIDLRKLKNGQIKWCAISRDLLWLFPKDKPKRIHIDGYGIYEVRDVMNARFNHRVDILLHPSNKKLINEEKVKVRILG